MFTMNYGQAANHQSASLQPKDRNVCSHCAVLDLDQSQPLHHVPKHPRPISPISYLQPPAF